MGLYKGLGAVLSGIVPKMAIRFTSYEWYKQLLANKETGQISSTATFFGRSNQVIDLEMHVLYVVGNVKLTGYATQLV